MALSSPSAPKIGRLVPMVLAINRIYTRHYHHLDVIAPCALPATGPAVFVCNHTSGLDPLLIQSCCKRTIIWMMAREYYEQPVVHAVLKQFGVIPVTRNGKDMAATRAAMRALKSGQVLGIFPEGRIETTEELLPFQTGAALLAARENAPIYPAYLDGTQRGKEMPGAFLRRQRARITFGAEIPPISVDPSRESLESATEQIQNAVRQLRINSMKSSQEQEL